MRAYLYIIVFLFPLALFGATSENYRLDQEGVGFVEFDGSSSNFGFKATAGAVGVGNSSSFNYCFNQGHMAVKNIILH